MAGVVSEQVDLACGGRQGGRATPFIWNALLDEAMSECLEIFEAHGFWLGDGVDRVLSHVLWADNIYLVSGTAEGIVEMATALRSALVRWRLDLKQDELFLLRGHAVSADCPLQDGFLLQAGTAAGAEGAPLQ
eukprot:2428477-Lingulodinium_polyedra.AAC.1